MKQFTARRAFALRGLVSVLAVLTLIAGFAYRPEIANRLAPSTLNAQGYSGGLPNVSPTAATGLGLTYTAGTVTQGGAQQAITANTLTAADTQTSCAAPAYTACNFIYWASGTSLSITQTASTAFAVGNTVIAFCTSTGGNITTCTPSSWAPSTASVNTTMPSGTNNPAGAYWVPPGNCWYSVATGTLTSPTFGAAPGVTALGLNVVGASNVPVMQVATTNAAVISVNTISCVINPPSTVGVTGRGVNLVNADVYYGIQQAGGVNATQATVAASGTFNGTTVFDKVAMPAPGAAETPSTVTPVRADAGTMVYSPVGASFNSLVTTAGAFFTQRFTPATPFGLTTDSTIYHINFTVLCNTTQATTINVAGVMIHFTS